MAVFDYKATELENEDPGALEALNTQGDNKIDWLCKKILPFSLSS